MLPVIVPQLGPSNVSNKLENVLKDVDKLNAEIKRNVARMYHAMSTSQWTEEEEITEWALISLFENSSRDSISAFSFLERKGRTLKAQSIKYANNLVDAVEGIMTLLTAKNEYGDDLVKVLNGDEPVSDIFNCTFYCTYFSVVYKSIILSCEIAC